MTPSPPTKADLRSNLESLLSKTVALSGFVKEQKQQAEQEDRRMAEDMAMAMAEEDDLQPPFWLTFMETAKRDALVSYVRSIRDESDVVGKAQV